MVNRRIWFQPRWRPAPRSGRPADTGQTNARIGLDPAHDLGFSEELSAGREPASVQGKKVLFINQYYWPDCSSTAQHLADLAESMAARGFECHVLASQSRYQPGEPKPPAHQIHKGVQIHRVPATSLGRRGTWARMTDYLSFYAGAAAKALLLPRFDVVVTLTTPPIIGLLGTLLKRLRGTWHVYWSMDLHPDASMALGRMSRRSLFGRVLYWLSSFVYESADKVVVLGPYMADRIARKDVPPERIVTIPVWSRRDEIYPTPRAVNPLRKSLGLGEKLVVMYSGNMGLAHTFDEFLEAARRLRQRADIVFLFVGGGPRSREVSAAQARDGLCNVQMLDYVPREQLRTSLTLADVHLISMRPEMTGIVVPGKLYGAMAAGRPAVFVGPEHCETADTIRSAGCGFALRLGDVDGLVSALELLASDPSVGRRMGERGLLALHTHYDERLCCNHWYELVRELLELPEMKSARPGRRESSRTHFPPLVRRGPSELDRAPAAATFSHSPADSFPLLATGRTRGPGTERQG
jgi:glycosyltransferase involved in cell wall biosynthesis